MKKFVTRLIAFAMIFGFVGLLNVSEAAAQGRSSSDNTIQRSVGLGAYLQFSHLEVLIPVWVSPKLVIVPVIGATNTENIGTAVTAGAILRIYQRVARLAPYFGVMASADVMMPSGGGGSTTDLQAGVLYGGEFFLNNQFSFGIEAHVVVFIPELGPRVVSTATLLLANLYF